MVITLHSIFYTSERLQTGFAHFYEGSNGVSLFFVISGFVMIISSEKLIEITGGWKIFAVKRALRIVPIYWIITTYKVITLLLASSLVYHGDLNFWFILKSYFFIPALNADGLYQPFYAVGWTLNFEMFFYLLFSVALAVRINPIAFLSAVFVPLAILSMYKTAHWPAIGFYADPIVLYFLYGMIAAKLILKGKKLPPYLAVTVVLSGLLYLFVPGYELSHGAYQDDEMVKHLATLLIVYGGASLDGLWSSKPPALLVYLGGASYSLYLVHPSVAPFAPTLLKILHIKWPWLAVAASILAAIAAGTLFYKYCEAPLTQFFTKKAKKWRLI
jgi:peptidoglycan/LPS O-acetylase OafA/YrhL